MFAQNLINHINSSQMISVQSTDANKWNVSTHNNSSMDASKV